MISNKDKMQDCLMEFHAVVDRQTKLNLSVSFGGEERGHIQNCLRSNIQIKGSDVNQQTWRRRNRMDWHRGGITCEACYHIQSCLRRAMRMWRFISNIRSGREVPEWVWLEKGSAIHLQYTLQIWRFINPSPIYTLDMDSRVSMARKGVSYNHMKVFNCGTFAHISKDEQFKLDGKTKSCIYLGISYNDEYMLWNP